MDDKTKKETEQKKKKASTGLFIAVVAGLFVVLGIAQYVAVVSHEASQTPPEEQVADTTADETTPDATAESQTTDEATAVPVGKVDVNAALSDRILGNTSAPVKISEHASLTCSHCAQFHKETFDKVKKAYIDTGKAYLVFSDFPLNAPAIHASMVARCLPEDKYFDFIHMLFEKQDIWAYDEGYLGFLKERAAENGLNEADFQACIQNSELQEGIINRMKAVQGQWNISSTPSFVLNNKRTVSGTVPIEEFDKIMAEELGAAAEPAKDAPKKEPAIEEKVEEKINESAETVKESVGKSLETEAVPAESPDAPASEESGAAE